MYSLVFRGDRPVLDLEGAISSVAARHIEQAAETGEVRSLVQERYAVMEGDHYYPLWLVVLNETDYNRYCQRHPWARRPIAWRRRKLDVILRSLGIPRTSHSVHRNTPDFTNGFDVENEIERLTFVA